VEAGRNGSDRPGRGSLEQTLLAALGWAALTVEGIDDLADDLARRVGLDRDAMRTALRDTLTAWRHEGERFNARRENVVDGVIGRLGVAQKAEVDDLVLRVAQLEHRLKLLERD
jgi:polyhydroxyalkanoate synthesis regulator phasin